MDRAGYLDRLHRNVPRPVKNARAWVLYTRPPKRDKAGNIIPGKFDKIPFYIDKTRRAGAQGSEADVKKLATFDDACGVLRDAPPQFYGLGVAVLEQAPFWAGDLDDISQESRKDFADKVTKCGTYVERSPSGGGLRAIFLGKPGIGNHKNHQLGVEVFESNGFVTITGDRVSAAAEAIAAPPELIAEIRSVVSGPHSSAGKSQTRQFETPPSESVVSFDLSRLDSELRQRVERGFPVDCEDRSATLFGICAAIRHAGFTKEDCYAIVGFACPKWLEPGLDRRSGDVESAREWTWKYGVHTAYEKTTLYNMSVEFEPIDDLETPSVPRATTDKKPPIVFRHIADIVAEKREPRWLIYKTLEAGVLSVLVGPRSTFKSFVMLDWAMRAALEGHGVVLLSGEGAGLDRRVDAWIRSHGANMDLRQLPLVALERPLGLNASQTVNDLSRALGALPWRPKLVAIDTLSKYSAGMNEQDNTEVAAYLSRLGAIRDAYDCTVQLICHTGHVDRDRPRGAYALMANPDSEHVITRAPGSMDITVSRDRFKDSPAMSPLAYRAEVIDLGRDDRYGDRVTSLALRAIDQPTQPKTKSKFGKWEKAIMAVVDGWLAEGPIGVDELLAQAVKTVPRDPNATRDRRRDFLRQGLESLISRNVLTLINETHVAL